MKNLDYSEQELSQNFRILRPSCQLNMILLVYDFFTENGAELTYGKKAPGRSFHYEIAGDFPLFYSTLSFGDDLICVLNWMGMVSFLSSPVLGTFWLKKVKRMHSEGCPF